MDFSVLWLDVGPYLCQREPPVLVLSWSELCRRTGGRNGEFWVPQGPLLGEADWSVTRAGDFVRVPVHAYRTQRRDPAHIWGLGVQVGLLALASLRALTSGQPRAAVLVLGDRCTDLAPAEEACRCYVGLAVWTQ